MDPVKRLRGRPKGSGKDDSAPLKMVADLMIRDASLKPTTAIRRVVSTRKDWGSSDDTLIRRLQGKWNKEGPALLEAAKVRARPKQVAHATHPFLLTGMFEMLVAEQRRIQDLIDPPHMRRIQEVMRQEIERMTQIRDIIDPPLMREFRHFEEMQKQISLFNRW